MAAMNQMEQKRLLQLTEELLRYNREAHDYYLHTVREEEGYEPDFFGKVKPFADAVKVRADEWKPLTLAFIRAYKPNYLYPLQVENTYENLEIVSVQAFYPKTGKKRFLEMIKSIDYILNQLKNDCQKLSPDQK
ncbi:YppE family protein [Halalkalibacterium ligniniphilum]|uniref:YppE family protein n=1 Tax=Halalkalibacterium ligniniphilum TaxID=1134413 RepID=UPI00034A1BA4|nr:YppE family protein [Halalkalibacterium ligniniphilum]